MLKRWDQWRRGESDGAVITRWVARTVARPGWLSAGAGAVATVTAYSAHPLAGGVVATAALLLAELRIAGADRMRGGPR